MSTHDMNGIAASRLAEFLKDAEDGRPAWSPDELGAILQHQLDTPLEYDLGNLERRENRAGMVTTSCRQLGIRTFADLLSHPRPSIDLLELAKRFAKASRGQPEGPLPPEIATYLYYATIAAARVRCGQRITELTDEALRAGFAWGRDCPWADAATCALSKDGLEVLAGGNDHG